MVHFYRTVWTAAPTGKVREVAAMLKTIPAHEDAKASKENARQVVEKRRANECLVKQEQSAAAHSIMARGYFVTTRAVHICGDHPLSLSLATTRLTVHLPRAAHRKLPDRIRR